MRSHVLALPFALVTGCFLDSHDPPPSGGDGNGSGSGSGGIVVSSNCPAGETCSPKTPDGLRFVGVPDVFDAYPNGFLSGVHRHIATGGTHDVRLYYPPTQNQGGELALAYTALSTVPEAIEVVASSGPHVSLRGHGGTTILRIVDPSDGKLFDRETYASSSVALAKAVPGPELFSTVSTFDGPTEPFAFATGTTLVGIALVNVATPPNRLVDTSMQLEAAGGTQAGWDTIVMSAPAAGHKTITVRAGDAPATNVDIEVVDHVDQLSLLFDLGSLVCYGATTHGAFVSGIDWTFTGNDGHVIPSDPRWGTNCLFDSAGVPPHTIAASIDGHPIDLAMPARTPQPIDPRVETLAATLR